ncbi:AFG1-like ATPase-domain-containing protein [Exophiala viscosa]|uniref:AFG1-like ATPase-domain-containing protein n=1 Tax=Exophiala viscosa TaxID=2486360 RepID=UPI00218D04E8|nr:AFG1-like ATPase-domain-containing protein [Exophiala viscosa]
MPPPLPPQNLSLSITNPLILYRALVATKKIKPDPAQHRLALQLQKLYFRLKDYAPEVEYWYRLEKIGRSVPVKRSRSTNDEPEAGEHGAEQRSRSNHRSDSGPHRGSRGGVLSSLLARASNSSSTLALTRTLPLHDSALSIDSPRGMLLYGEVGRGKSMLLDLLYESLPSRKKRRWHYNTFMLDVFRRIELARLQQIEARPSLFGRATSENEHVVLRLARDTVCDSPILFLDEFQMPDRTASKLVGGFFTSFFHLGGVLVASSNRMPEELSKAAGIEFSELKRRFSGGGGLFGLGWGLGRASEGEKSARSDFGMFLDVLRARCEVWEMEGERDWRREIYHDEVGEQDQDVEGISDEGYVSGSEAESVETEGVSVSTTRTTTTSTTTKTTATATTTTTTTAVSTEDDGLSADSPPHYHVIVPSSPSGSFATDLRTLNPSDTWTSTTLTVYARPLHLRATHGGILKSSFSDLCATYLGPADYVSLCSTFHTLIIADVPVLTSIQKNEARRFITLLDALYEARCRLLIEAAAPPDKLFFPETRRRAGVHDVEESDSITSEAFSEMYQDSTAPFRPNVSIYAGRNERDAGLQQQAFTASLLDSSRRSVLADEDADFGPTYGNGRGRGMSNSDVEDAVARQAIGPDFTSTGVLTGEDERFAYKRARSRLWEMCGRRWWDERLAVMDDMDEKRWWRPLDRQGRTWESFKDQRAKGSEVGIVQSGMGVVSGHDEGNDPRTSSLFRHGASPYRTAESPPPKFGFQHAWGMMKWGKKAGQWGKGTDAYNEENGETGKGSDEERKKR